MERIGSDAPPEAFFAAQAILAASYEASQDWSKAARNWAQVRTNPKLAQAAKGAGSTTLDVVALRISGQRKPRPRGKNAPRFRVMKAKRLS